MGACTCKEKYSRDAPHLDEYFETLKDVMTGPVTTGIQEVTTLVVQAIMGEDEGKKTELIEKMKKLSAEAEEAKEPLKDILRKAFDLHDGDKNGILDEEEAEIFFQDFVERYVPFTCKCTNEMLDKALATQMKQLEATMEGMPELLETCKSNLTKQVKEQRSTLVASFKAKGDAYKADKAAKDKAAFAVLDVNGDGKLQKEEVVNGFFPDTGKYVELNQALGLMTEAEVEQHKKSVVIKEKMLSGEFTMADLMPGPPTEA
eukprot:gnl/TRDRNA2_/TRDRNA2_33986_c0_seq1.p1 gnl/TRDRNA2_/TRDRNA2_33986_c0~~gnl/TRDRNA2_/TRDRNA2_33986_c0_seq1.p1  ORF type:complete len:260 (-),score=84.97 gnl/TRDRNA2_/TRDRNA2_33986_c0_seq1:55-834(-)